MLSPFRSAARIQWRQYAKVQRFAEAHRQSTCWHAICWRTDVAPVLYVAPWLACQGTDAPCNSMAQLGYDLLCCGIAPSMIWACWGRWPLAVGAQCAALLAVAPDTVVSLRGLWGFWLPALSRYSRVGHRHSAGEDRETIRTSRSIGVDYDGAQAPEITCTRAEGRPGSATPPEKLGGLALDLPAHGGAHTSKDVRISSTLTTCWRRPAAQWRGSCASASTRIINYCPRRPLWRSSLLSGMPQLSGQRYAVLAGFSGPTILTALTSAATAMTSPPTDIA